MDRLNRLTVQLKICYGIILILFGIRLTGTNTYLVAFVVNREWPCGKKDRSGKCSPKP